MHKIDVKCVNGRNWCGGSVEFYLIFPYTIRMDNKTNPTTPESKVPEPPALEIDIRTMESDIKAFKEGGGEVPTEGAQESFASQRPDDMQKAPAPAYTGPEKPLFETPVTPVAPVQQIPQQTSTGTMKMVLITVGVIIGIVGLGLLGYFVLFPYLFKLIG